MRDNNKTIARNSVYLYVRTFFSIIVSLYTSRLFLETLGIEDFGIYNLVGGVIAFFSILKGFMTGSIQRFLNIEIGRNDRIQESKILDISININNIIILVFILVAESVGLWLVLYKLNIPTGKENITLLVYQITIFTVAISTLNIPYSAYIVAHEKMSFFASISIFEVVMRLFITMSLIWFSDKLVVFSLLVLLLNVIITLLHYLYCRYYIKMLNYKWYSPFRNKEYKELIAFSTWTVVGNGACIVRDQGISLVFNFFKGVVLNASMGIVMQVSNVYSTLFANVQTAFLPQIVQNSLSNKTRFEELINYSCLASFLLMAYVCIPMIACADYILHLWLGDMVPDYTVVFVQIFMIKILIVSSSQALYSSLVAVGKIKESQIWFTFLSLFTVIGAYLILLFNLPIYFSIWLVVLMDLVMLIIRVVYIQKYTTIEAKSIAILLWRPYMLVLLCLCPISFYLSSFSYNLIGFISTILFLTICNTVISYMSINKDIRKNIVEIVYAKFLKKF